MSQRLARVPAKLGLVALLVAGMLLSGTAAWAESLLRRGIPGEPNSLDPAKGSLFLEYYLMKELYEGLVIYDAAGKIAPGVAQSWSISPDGSVYTFKLRGNAKWSDGSPVTAEDFVFSLRRLEDPKTAAMYPRIQFPIKNARKFNSGEISVDQLGVRAIDATTLEITLERPTPYFLELMAHGTALPVNRASVEKNGTNFSQPGIMVSNGAFRLVGHVANDTITMEKNDAYWDAANVKLDKVVYTPFVNTSAAVRRFEAGEMDMVFSFPASDLKRLRQTYGSEVHVSPGLGTEYYAFDTQVQPFDDVRVRRALSMVIDRDFLAQETYNGSATSSYSMLAPGIASYGKPTGADFADLSQLDREDMAAKLMKDAGYGVGGKLLNITIRYNTDPTNERAATAIADMWKRAFGANVSLNNLDLASHYAYLQQGGKFDVARGSRTAEYADAENVLALDVSTNKTYNYAKYNSPEFDALLAKSYTEGDAAVRSATLHQAEAIQMHDQPEIPLVTLGNLWLISSHVKGYQDNSVNEHLSKFLSVSD